MALTKYMKTILHCLLHQKSICSLQFVGVHKFVHRLLIEAKFQAKPCSRVNLAIQTNYLILCSERALCKFPFWVSLREQHWQSSHKWCMCSCTSLLLRPKENPQTRFLSQESLQLLDFFPRKMCSW